MSIKIDLKIFALILLLMISGQTQIYLLIFAFTIIHEIGHLICGIILGLKPQSMKLMPMGLCVIFKNENKKWWKKLLVSLAGPMINLMLAWTFIFSGQITIVYANLLIGIFNLIPIIPLDGGRALRELLRRFFDYKTADNYIHIISNITMVVLTAFASIGTLYLKNITIPLIVAYLWLIVLQENKRYKMKKKMQKSIEIMQKMC